MTQDEEPEKLYTLAQTAELFNVSTDTVRTWAKEGKMGCIFLPNGHRRIPLSAIKAVYERKYP